ncbi:hypothetical protein [Plastoroseomonas hellenica]|uniref:hypothetical protein n=1 Tax=Plastoroseomonas hellenica TaxID=2687306 RepID=UPI001BA731A2|nr:hypothetical protein [Plastoroseomonas hellenica]MBR0643651.1 hypothetical protein [Plastoroseomonas hellenica]
MPLPDFIPVSAVQVVTSFKQVLHGTPVVFRVGAEGWLQGIVFSESRENGVVSLEAETLGRFWGADELTWPLLDAAGSAELGIDLHPCPGDTGATPEPDGALYAKYEEGEQFRGLYLAAWREVAGERQSFRMMSFKDPLGGSEEAIQWARWGHPRLLWMGERNREA